MQDIRKMLRLNLEIEGCLRILLDRPNAEAEEILIDKLDELSALAKGEDAADAADVADVADAAEAVHAQQAPLKFSINDKYRFIREIFGNSAPAFNDAIEMVGSMRSLDEAYDYFLNELGWDADDEAVSDFLVIVANHFNSAQ